MNKSKGIRILASVFMVCAGLFNGTTKADVDYLKILSPMPGSKVKDGELFIAVQLTDSQTFRKTSVRLMMDDYVINYQAKVTDKKVTLLYLDHLRAGKHHIKMNSQTSDGGQLAVLEWDFEIAKPVADSMQAAPAQLKKDYDITGFISLASRIDTATGPGKGLRQTPFANHEVSFNIEPRIKSVSFPISGYFTNTDYAYLQPRSKFRVGIKTNFLEAYYGDNFPMYDPVVISGIRVHGYEAILKLRRLTLSVVQGDLTRAVDGQILKVRKDTAFIPYNLRRDALRDSFYINPGVYRRSIIAARLNAGKEAEGSIFGISLLRAQDDTNSIKVGTAPKQNIAFGLDQAVISQNGVFRESAGFAMSMTTNDYSRKALTEDEIDTNLRQNTSINPAFFKNLIIINPSTEPLLPQRLSSASWFVKSSLKFLFNRLALDYHRTGPSYYSFGNPFMRNDIQEVSLADNMNFWKRRIGFQLKYMTNENNLYKQLTNRLVNNYYIASISFSPSPKLPQLFASFRENDRITTSYIESFYKITDKMLSYNGGASYRIPEGKSYATNLSVTYSGTVRNNSSLPDNNSRSDVIFATMQQSLAIPLILSVQYSKYNTTTVQGSILQKLNSYGGAISYNFKKPKITLGIAYNSNMNIATIYTSANSRNTLVLQYRQEISKHLNFTFEGGQSQYRDDIPNNRYDDFYGTGGLNILF